MKYFIVFALFTLVAAKPSPRTSQAEIDEIVAAINSPSTDPATAAVLEHLLQVALGIFKPEPIQIGPETIDFEPIHVGPEIIDFEPVHVGPEIIDFEPIHVGPEIVDIPIPEGATTPTPTPTPASSPLVQIIVNVKSSVSVPGASPVVVEGLEKPTPVDPPSPVIVVEDSYALPEHIIVADSLPPLPEPINVAPGIVAPIAVAPEVLV